MTLHFALGMKYMHSRKVLHLDLKPENVLLHDCDVSRQKVVKICDFGLSILSGQKIMDIDDEQLCGTPQYMPPEILDPCGMDPTEVPTEEEDARVRGDPFKWDIYSLGMIVNEALTREKPYKQYPSMASIITAVLVQGKRPRLSDNEQFAGLICEMWDTEPSKRLDIQFIVSRIRKVAGSPKHVEKKL